MFATTGGSWHHSSNPNLPPTGELCRALSYADTGSIIGPWSIHHCRFIRSPSNSKHHKIRNVRQRPSNEAWLRGFVQNMPRLRRPPHWRVMVAHYRVILDHSSSLRISYILLKVVIGDRMYFKILEIDYKNILWSDGLLIQSRSRTRWRNVQSRSKAVLSN